MSHEIYHKWFNEVVNQEKNYDLQPNEAADLGWDGAKNEIIKLLKENIQEIYRDGEIFEYIPTSVINKIEELM